ncbi:polyphosphate kinase 1 [Spirochaeta lutea]|uniref:Polyphosphate kinase n=1 Tax=Spirochaeta lutea TaxID=1480694 RepID=A0A098QWY0_9SPIO|nr:polyphosphate kinase 1 [Spirochaeta lutea]KGE71903.1 polyphosphate kinase [Spirochaeta lutea]
MSTTFQRFFNRELSWLEFNRRVLSEAQRKDKPLLERLKFLAIVSANLDEFFMVRMASLKRQYLNGNYTTCPSRMSPEAQLKACSDTVRELVQAQYECLLHDVFPKLTVQGLEHKVQYQDLDPEQRSYAKSFFTNQVFPLLTPVRMNVEDPTLRGANLRLQVAFLLHATQGVQLIRPEDQEDHLAIVQIPSSLDRVVFLPDRGDHRSFVLLETLIEEFAHTLFPGYDITEHLVFRVTRDADFGVDESRDEDFVEAMEQVLNNRDKSMAVRMTVGNTSDRLREILRSSLGLSDREVYSVPEPLELNSLMAIVALPGFDHLKIEGWPPMDSTLIPEDESVFEQLKRGDVLLHHPFESFNPVIRMVEEAAEDPQVLAIKMTLYRTSGNSPIVRALQRAAQNGKQVTVLVELKARFDEQRNISWAERLEQAGVIVIYGIAQLKVHAKAMLVVRKESFGIKRYLHLGTGNYNDKTAKLYTDMSILTSRDDLCYEAGLFFNAITGYSAIPNLTKLLMAPHVLKPRLLELIHREIQKSSPEVPGLIIAKLNALADVDIIEALYRANNHHVRIFLNIRGICMLVPGVPGQSENIRVSSIVDRYLEHTRALFVGNGGDGEYYLSSADWMPRNLERRVELMFPIEQPELKQRLRESLDLCLGDNQQAYELQPDGSYTRIQPGPNEPPLESQWARYQSLRQTKRAKKAINRQEFSVRRKPPKATQE